MREKYRNSPISDEDFQKAFDIAFLLGELMHKIKIRLPQSPLVLLLNNAIKEVSDFTAKDARVYDEGTKLLYRQR